MSVQITPPSQTDIPPEEAQEVTQSIRISGVDKHKALKVRLRVEYKDAKGGMADHTIDVNLADFATDR
jgi:hypothetical protein